MKSDNENRSVLALVSGGMDSVTALYYSAKNFQIAAGLSFDYDAKHNNNELPFAAEHCAMLGIRHIVIKLPFINEWFKSALLKSGEAIPEGPYDASSMSHTVVPFRNGIMISIAAGLAESMGAGGLVIAAHEGDHAVYPDCRSGFMSAMDQALRKGTYAGVRLIRPFIEMDKTRIVKLGRELGVDFARTWSCYKGEKVHCGKCGTCIERREAFKAAGMNDPVMYQSGY